MYIPVADFRESMKPNDSRSESSFKQINSQHPVVVTYGEATVKRAPDQAWLSIFTETRAPRAEEARRMSAETMTTIQSRLLNVGLSASAIRTTGYQLTPEIEWKNGRGAVRGYLVRNQIEVRVDELDSLSNVIDAANATRETSLTISGPRLGLKDEGAVETEALKLAVLAALGRAKAIAAGAGKALGGIVRIEEQNLGGRSQEPLLMRVALAKSDENVATPIVLGDIEVRVMVVLTAELA